MAAASSACCWLPLVTVGLGLGAGGAAAMLERYRWAFLGAAAVLPGIGFYLNYRREDRCAPDGACPPPRPLLRTANRVVLWTSALLVAVFALFPHITSSISSGARAGTAAPPPDSSTIVLNVGGMTCATCEAPVEQALRTVKGVRGVHADATSGRVTLTLDGSAAPNDSLMHSSLEAAGYQLLRRASATTASGSPRSLIRLSADGHELRAAFNRDVGSVRLVALLSPT